MRTTVEIPDELFRRVKVTAALRGKRVKDLVEEGLLLVLESPQASMRDEKQPRSVYDLMERCIGIVDSGIDDLASDSKSLEGLGRDSMSHR